MYALLVRLPTRRYLCPSATALAPSPHSNHHSFQTGLSIARFKIDTSAWLARYAMAVMVPYFAIPMGVSLGRRRQGRGHR